MKKGGWIWLFIVSMFSTEAKGDQSGKWERMEIFSKSFNEQDSLSLDLTAEEWEMVVKLRKLNPGKNFLKIYRLDQEYYGFIDCLTETYQWDGGDWKYFSGMKNSGSTCNNYIYYKDGKVFSIGGTGFWQNHLDWFSFVNQGALVFHKTSEQPENFFGALNFETEEGLFTLNGVYFDKRKGVEQFNWGGYFLDFKTKIWKPVNFQFNENLKKILNESPFKKEWELGGSFSTKDYAFFEVRTLNAKSAWFIINKKNLDISLKVFNQFFLTDYKWILQKENNIKFFPNSAINSIEFQIDDLFKSALPVGKLSLKKNSSLPVWLVEFGTAIVGMVLVLTLLVVFWMVLHRKQKPVSIEASPEFSVEKPSSFARLKPYSGQVISQEVMDEILSVHEQKNPDIRKVNRSRGIREINDWHEKAYGAPLITRVKDQSDRRVIWYQVGILYPSNRTMVTSESLVK